jgi:hypothetical protein
MVEAELIVTSTQRKAHKECELAWKQGQKEATGCIPKMAINLYKIREMGTWSLGGYKSMNEYLEGEGFSFSQPRGIQLMNAGEALIKMGLLAEERGIEIVLPFSDAHAQMLRKIGDDESQWLDVWTEALKQSGGKTDSITKKILEKIADQILPSRTQPARGRPPTGGGGKSEQKRVAVKKNSEELPEDSAPIAPSIAVPTAVPETEYTGKPSGGTTFNPGEFDASQSVDTTNAPACLKEVIPSALVVLALQKDVAALKKRILEFSESPGGFYFHKQDAERLCDQIRENLKEAVYERICAGCKGEPVKSCKHCQGCGFTSHGQGRTLTKEDKAWLAKQPFEGEYR